MSRASIFLLGLAISALAGRQSLSNIGLSAYVPDGWVLKTVSDSSYAMYDTTVVDVGGVKSPRYGGQILFDAYSGVAAQGAKTWDSNSAAAWNLYLANDPCNGWVYRHDSTNIDGYFAVYVQGEQGVCDSTTAATLSMNSLMVFDVAQGDVGWEISIVSDTADFNAKYFDYRDLIDSIQIDPTYTKLQFIGVAPRKIIPSSMSLEPKSWGMVIRPRDESALDLRVVDVAGRPVGRLERVGTQWNWTPGSGRGPCWAILRTPTGVTTRALPTLH